MTPPLRLVFWETTKACNLTCRHCRAAIFQRWFERGQLSQSGDIGDSENDRDPLRRIFGVQIERKPLDFGAVPALEPRRALSRDVAEGSYVVRPEADARPVDQRHRCRLNGVA